MAVSMPTIPDSVRVLDPFVDGMSGAVQSHRSIDRQSDGLDPRSWLGIPANFHVETKQNFERRVPRRYRVLTHLAVQALHTGAWPRARCK